MTINTIFKGFNIALLSMLLIACGSDSEGPDTDGDTIPDARDNCPAIANTDQLNTDGGEKGNACDLDDDNDGVLDEQDAFPLDATESKDTDSDTIGDNTDNCPILANTNQLNTDGDSAGDACDDLPQDASDTQDFDGDKIGNTADTDDDNDKTLDVNDAFPFDATEQADIDQDGIGDNKDLDITSTNPNSMQLDQLIANGRVTKFIGGVTNQDERDGRIGFMVKDIGDVNGDGINDIYVGNHRVEINDFYTGLGYILFGQGTGWPATVDLADLANIPHVVLKGDTANAFHSEMGAGIAPVGDIDGDGIDDFMISATVLNNPDVDELYNGAVFLVFGRRTWITDAGEDKTITAADLANYSVTFRSKLTLGLLGGTLENVGDVNNDGLIDVAISENLSGDYRFGSDGRVHLMFNIGRYTKANISEVHDIEDIANTADTLNRVVLEGETNYFGESLQAMGDFNADGYTDLIISDAGSDKDPDTSLAGSMYVVFGKASASWPDTWNLDTITADQGFIFSNIGGEHDSHLGRDFKIADLNADQIPDVIISYISDNQSAITYISNIYVLWGGDKTWPPLIASNNIATELGLTMLSEEQRVYLGTQIEVVPDLNNNGYPELLIATGDSSLVGENPANKIYKMDASLIEQGLEIGPSLLEATDAQRITMSHIEEDDTFYMNVISDVNGDGFSEMTFSASRKDSNSLINNGEFYLLYGYDQLYPQAFKVSE
jgi:hypothetical protein